MPRTFEVVNLGCKVNRVESDRFEAALRTSGFQGSEGHGADVVVVNTCTVTGEAEKKTRKAVRRALRRNPQAIVYVTGCAAALDAATYQAMDGRVRVLGKSELLEELQHPVEGCSAPQAALPADRVRVGVKVQDGCSNACTYCIVHVARGPARSVAPDGVIAQCCSLVEEGVPEVVLTGINLGAYEWEGMGLSGLLERLLEEVPWGTSSRMRLSSLEPQDVTEGLVKVIARSQGLICRHLHLPLQSGSSRMLHQMGRRYDAPAFAATVELLRGLLPTLSLTTDVIVGFPGETEEDFQATLSLCEQAAFSKIHVFPYSLRAGTPAAKRPDQIPFAVKQERARILRSLSGELRRLDLIRRLGSRERVVIEQEAQGRTESYHEVPVSPELPVGVLLEVEMVPRMLECHL